MRGLKLSDLTPALLDKVLNLYGKIAGGHVFYASASTSEARLRWIKEGLERTNCVDWRYGSRLIWNGKEDDSAKFCTWHRESVYEDGTVVDLIISFSFDPNIVSGKEADDMRDAFARAVDALLEEEKLAIELKG